MLPPSFASWLTPTVRPKLGKQAVNEAQAADDLREQFRLSSCHTFPEAFSVPSSKWFGLAKFAIASAPCEREAEVSGAKVSAFDSEILRSAFHSAIKEENIPESRLARICRAIDPRLHRH